MVHRLGLGPLRSSLGFYHNALGGIVSNVRGLPCDRVTIRVADGYRTTNSERIVREVGEGNCVV